MDCSYCGEVAFLDLLEIWPAERAWMFETCCEDAYYDVLEALETDEAREEVAELLRDYGINVRRIYSSSIEFALRMDYNLELRDVDLKTAKAFVEEHHRHNKPPVSWRWGHAVYNGDDLIGVAMVGRPVARMIDGSTTVEVNRLCVRADLDGELVWNACSMLYGAAAREAKRRGFEKIITYTLETEDGTTLRAVGWDPEHRTRGGSWNRPSRAREDKAPTCRKIRWARYFRRAQAA